MIVVAAMQNRNWLVTACGSEKKVPVVGAVSLTEDEHPFGVKLTPVPDFTFRAQWEWPRQHSAPDCTAYLDGLACFNAVTMADCAHQHAMVSVRKPRGLPESQ